MIRPQTGATLIQTQLFQLSMNTLRFWAVDKAVLPPSFCTKLSISIDDVTRQLEGEGIEKLSKPFDKLLETLAQRSPRHLTRESCK
jgi:hypothetical protein